MGLDVHPEVQVIRYFLFIIVLTYNIIFIRTIQLFTLNMISLPNFNLQQEGQF